MRKWIEETHVSKSTLQYHTQIFVNLPMFNSFYFSRAGRCVCPENSHGPHCKILTRQFHRPKDSKNSDSSWHGSYVWLPPLKPCSKLSLGLKVLTKESSGLILSSEAVRGVKSGLRLLLKDGAPVFVLTLDGQSVATRVNVSVSDSKWHDIEMTWKNRVS